jgi:hypothetical protein
VGDIKSECWATSARNAGRQFPGIAGDMTPEFARRADEQGLKAVA